MPLSFNSQMSQNGADSIGLGDRCRDSTNLNHDDSQATSVDLRRFAIFHSLSQEQQERLRHFLRPRCFEAGTVVLRQGDTGSGLFLLLEGSVKVVVAPPHRPSTSHRLINPRQHPAVNRPAIKRPKADNRKDAGNVNNVRIAREPIVRKESILAICGPGETLGEIDLADGSGHTASVVTLEDCSFLWMATIDFRRCRDAMPQLARNLSRLLAARLRWATAVRDALTTLHLPGKIAYQLLLLAQDYGIGQGDGSVLLPLQLKQSEVAALVVSSRECVNRVFASFRDQGYIAVHPNRNVSILNAAALQGYCEGLRPDPRDWPGRTLP